MITIEHYGSEYPPMVSWSIRDAMVGETAEHMGTYWSGIQPPNFPVPATMFHSAVANFHNREWSWKWAVEWTKVRLRK